MSRRIGIALRMFSGVAALVSPIIVGIMTSQAVRAQTGSADTPRFEVASIKLCDSNQIPGTRGGGSTTVTPRGLTINCQPLIGIIQVAYLDYAGGHHKITPPMPIEGAPNWLESDRYMIQAKTAVDVSSGIIQGPMVQALLEDRFKLKIHHQTREVPVYELTVAKGGPKLKAFDGGCTPVNSSPEPLTPRQLTEGGYCRPVPSIKVSGSTYAVDGQRSSIDDFVNIWLIIGRLSDRPVINKTGISGLFDFHLEFSVDPGQPRSMPVLQEQLGDVLEKQLGLKLRPARGPSSEFLVLDHIDRHPSED